MKSANICRKKIKCRLFAICIASSIIHNFLVIRCLERFDENIDLAIEDDDVDLFHHLSSLSDSFDVIFDPHESLNVTTFCNACTHKQSRHQLESESSIDKINAMTQEKLQSRKCSIYL